ncbi:MAG: PilZ domain-containing protein [Treponema sp.]|nr:PilZ domain-containing protein [Treponema sp.]
MSIFTGIEMYLLQAPVTTFRMYSPTGNSMRIFGIVLGSIILLIIIISFLSKRFKIPALGGTQTVSTPRRFSRFSLHRHTGSLGFNRDQVKMLEFVLKNDGVTDPARSLNSPTLLDRHFKRAYRTIERTAISEEELNNRLAILFSIRNILESSMGDSAPASTRQIPVKTAAVLEVGEKNFPARVISTKGDTLVVENPLNNKGEPLRIPRGNKVNLSIFTGDGKGYSVESRVLGSKDTENGPILQLVHSGQMKRLSNRRFRRRQAVISTAFYLVRVEIGPKKVKKMVVDTRKFSGNILDISIGGCSIKSAAPITANQRIKIEFTREDHSIVVALGEVLRINRAGANTIMHVKFLKVPRKSLNSINAMVYDYVN